MVCFCLGAGEQSLRKLASVHLSQAEIRKSRDNAWKLFETRKHTVSRVYSSNNEADDLLFIAWVAMDLKNGENVAGEFVGRLQMADTQSQIPRIRSYSIWGVGLRWNVQIQL